MARSSPENYSRQSGHEYDDKVVEAHEFTLATAEKWRKEDGTADPISIHAYLKTLRRRYPEDHAAHAEGFAEAALGDQLNTPYGEAWHNALRDYAPTRYMNYVNDRVNNHYPDLDETEEMIAEFHPESKEHQLGPKQQLYSADSATTPENHGQLEAFYQMLSADLEVAAYRGTKYEVDDSARGAKQSFAQYDQALATGQYQLPYAPSGLNPESDAPAQLAHKLANFTDHIPGYDSPAPDQNTAIHMDIIRHRATNAALHYHWKINDSITAGRHQPHWRRRRRSRLLGTPQLAPTSPAGAGRNPAANTAAGAGPTPASALRHRAGVLQQQLHQSAHLEPRRSHRTGAFPAHPRRRPRHSRSRNRPERPPARRLRLSHTLSQPHHRRHSHPSGMGNRDAGHTTLPRQAQRHPRPGNRRLRALGTHHCCGTRTPAGTGLRCQHCLPVRHL